MAEKDFQKLVETEVDAFVDHKTGPYSSGKRQAWIDARDECDEEFWNLVTPQGSGHDSE
ncbi:MAG: hypothetical protein HLUCCX14_07145 [Marinobacter excellens HL-55]|uniref:Uncharacterized protein n=1 Tax=Marinobacter excellens HL-55 TaxID=1305731 RepID=A0A0P8D0M3_9GAMM|nr:MAG: hypothetical protein HLUCCX14_07145 [Marinobacter excellens HL-55]